MTTELTGKIIANNSWNILPLLQTRMSDACTAAPGIYEPGIFGGQISEEMFLKYL